MMLSSSSPLQELNEGWFVCLLDRGVPFRCVWVSLVSIETHVHIDNFKSLTTFQDKSRSFL